VRAFGEQIDDFLYCCIGTVVGRLEPAIGSVATPIDFHHARPPQLNHKRP
jgi:hypothetical protein